jgi:hypothetical protein
MTADERYAKIIHDYIEHVGGDSIATNLVMAARHAGLKLSLACGLIEQESEFRNVFGHDPTIFVGAGKVTRTKYLAYKARRGHTRMQGVGPAQLTYWSYQDEADKLGGCWKPYCNLLVGFRALAANIQAHGTRTGLAVYNGGEGNPQFGYADHVLSLTSGWHSRLT